MDEPTDTVAPWTIKAVPTSTRDAVTKAARQEGLTVGQWLERRVNEWLADGGPVAVSHGQPRSASALTVVSPRGASDVEELRTLATLARELSPADKDTAAMRLARRAVADRLRGFVRPSASVGNSG